MNRMDANLPATTDETAVPARAETAGELPPPARRRQNITTGLFPLALGLLVSLFGALAIWTLMATTGGGL
jgi:hypothetical protein